MKNSSGASFLFTFFLAVLSSVCSAQKPVTIGHSLEINSAALGEKRIVNVSLPQGYDENDTAKYPVIYIIDGGMEEDFLHITGIVRYYTQPWINRFPASIVVGIENVNRRRDCTFAVDNLDFLEKTGIKKTAFPQYGGSARYIKFLGTELQPLIDSAYRTNKRNTIIGESLAGLLTTEILLRHRDLFDTYVIITPSLWWGDGRLLKEAPSLPASREGKVSVYVGACNKQEDPGMHDHASALYDLLRRNGGRETVSYFDYLPQEIHSTVIHQAVYNAFRMIYPKNEYGKK